MKAQLLVLLLLTGFFFQDTARGYAHGKKMGCGLNVTFKTKDESNNLGNGEIILTIKDGAAPLTFLWASYGYSSSDKDIKNLKAGFYTVIIRDANGCIEKIDNIQVKSSISN